MTSVFKKDVYYNNIQFKHFVAKIKNKKLEFSYQLKEEISNDRLGYLILERDGVVDLLKHKKRLRFKGNLLCKFISVLIS